MSDAAVETAEPKYVQPPRVCGNEAEKIDWVASSAFQLDDEKRFGIRYTSAELQKVVEAALADRLVDDADAPALFSLRLGTGGKRKGAPLHHLYHGGRVAFGTRDIARLVTGALDFAGSAIAGDRPGLVVHVSAALTPSGSLVLLPAELRAMAKQVDKSLTAKGFAFADVPSVVVDPDGQTVDLTRPEVGIDWSAVDVDALRSIGPSAVEPTVERKVYPLARWLLAVGPANAGDLSPAAAVANIARLLTPPFAEGGRAVLETLAGLVSRASVTGVSWSTPEELVDQVAATA